MIEQWTSITFTIDETDDGKDLFPMKDDGDVIVDEEVTCKEAVTKVTEKLLSNRKCEYKPTKANVVTIAVNRVTRKLLSNRNRDYMQIPSREHFIIAVGIFNSKGVIFGAVQSIKGSIGRLNECIIPNAVENLLGRNEWLGISVGKFNRTMFEEELKKSYVVTVRIYNELDKRLSHQFRFTNYRKSHSEDNIEHAIYYDTFMNSYMY